MVRSGIVRQFWFVRFRSVAVCSGVVWQLRFGCAGWGRVWLVVAVKVRFAVFRPVMACSGKERYGSRGTLRHVKAWFGAARCGMAGT